MRTATAVFISVQWSYCSCTSLRHCPLEQTWYEWTCCVSWKVNTTSSSFALLPSSSASCSDPVLQNLFCVVSELILLSRAFGTVWLWCIRNSGLKETWCFKLHSMEGILYWQNSIFWLLRILFASFELCFL